jgi:hypothetical protein
VANTFHLNGSSAVVDPSSNATSVDFRLANHLAWDSHLTPSRNTGDVKMIARASNQSQPAPISFSIRQGSEIVQLTYEQLFAAGYKLWLARKYEHAATIFERLTAASDRGPRAHIFLAHCRAMLEDYGGCCAALNEALGEERYGMAATDLHDAFVYWRVGLWSDVKQTLGKIVSDHPDLPTPCLLLASLASRSGNRRLVARYLQMAVKRDRSGGAIGQVARSLLAKLIADSS